MFIRPFGHNGYCFALLAMLPLVSTAQPLEPIAAEPFAVERIEAPDKPAEAGLKTLFQTAESQLPQPLSVTGADSIEPYVASVPVRSRFANDRNDSLQAALAIVLQRLSGDVNAAKGQQELLNRASQLVQQYRYETPPPSADGFGPRPAQLRLRAEFSPSVMRQEMLAAGVPRWEGERPATLLWPLQRIENSWQLLPVRSSLRALWQQQASERGLQLFLAQGELPAELRQLPLAALDEQLLAVGEGLLSNAHEPVRVIVSSAAQQWSQLAATQRSWLSRGEQSAGLATLLDGYANRSTAVVATGQTVDIQVANIASVAGYAALQQYLQQVKQVQKRRLRSANADSVTLRVQLLGDAELLRSELSLGGRLVAVDTTTNTALNYRWAGQ